MMTAEKIDFVKESIKASYIAMPGAVPHTANAPQTDFMKTLEQSASAHNNEIPFVDKTSNDKPVASDNGLARRNDESMDGEKAHARKDPSDQPKTDGENEKKTTAEKQKEKPAEKPAEKPVDQEQKNKGDNTAAESGDPSKAKKAPGMDERATALKDILKQHNVQIKRIDVIKEDMKDNFSEAKAMTPNHSAEKLLLDKLGDDKDHTTKAGKVKNSKSEEPSTDKKMMKEVETAQKDDATALQKNEPKAEKSAKIVETPIFSLTNDNSKSGMPIPDAKIAKTPTPQTLLDQYQGLKDKINQTVENSIKFMLANGENRISLKLYPPELGRVEVELTFKDNKINAKISTENIAVKEVIQSNLDQLKSNLQNAGATIQKMDVEVGGFKNQFDQNFSNGMADSGSGRHGQNGGAEGGSSKDPNEPTPGKIVNHKAQSYFLGRSINVII